MNGRDPWEVFDYEVDMFFGICDLLAAAGDDVNQELGGHIVGTPEERRRLKNATVESAGLHARNLAEIILSRGTRDDDIRLSDLSPTFASPTLDKLDTTYGRRGIDGSPCQRLNTRLMHSTVHRGREYEYGPILQALRPLFAELVQQIRARRVP